MTFMQSILSPVACSIVSRGHTHISDIFSCPSPCDTPPDGVHFPLDTLGVAGVFGGDEAVSAIATIHVYEKRRWLGWYNSPGSYQMAKRFRRLTKSTFPDHSSPGIHADPATLLGSDISKGPKFRGTQSGTIIKETSRLAALFIKECATREPVVVEGRRTEAVGVTIAKLNNVPEPETYPRRISAHSPAVACIPITASVSSCIVCGIVDDWYAFWLILLGIVANGISCFVIGSANLVFTRPRPAEGSPPGDGILGSTREIVLLKGVEGAVNSVTRGECFLRFSSERHYRSVRWCSHLFTIQFIAQLLLLPKCSPNGQITFAISFAASWAYNSWLFSLDKEKIQREILFDTVLKKPIMTRYSLGTRTTAVVFILLVLQPEEPTETLDALLPNNDKVWKQWKGAVVARLRNRERLEFVDTDWYLDGFTQLQRSLLETLYGDTQAAYDAYIRYVSRD